MLQYWRRLELTDAEMKNHHYLQSNSRKKTKENGHIFWRRPKKVWKEIITVLPCSSLTNLWQIVKHLSSIFKLLWRKHRVVWMPGKRRVSSLTFLLFICFLKVSFFGDKMIVMSESPDEIYNVRWRKLTASTSIPTTALGMVPDSSSCKLLLPYSREPHLDMKIERIIRITKIPCLIWDI